MMHKLLLASAFALPLLTAQAASADQDTTPKDDSAVMTAIDPDHDGSVSLEEATAAAEKKFDALDTDKEGTLDKNELIGILDAKKVTATDKDRDGTLDKKEYVALVTAMFKKADPDHDGTLDPAELSTAQGRALVALLAY